MKRNMMTYGLLFMISSLSMNAMAEDLIDEDISDLTGISIA
ncbi:MAG: hypothetical protein Q9M14_01670 [Mariprofundaceae bacterium]|nr:hypothetical protein [Mariprofundaceae bacterium]